MDNLNEEDVKKLREMLDTWNDAQAGIRVVVALGTAIKWIAGVSAAIAVIWAVFHGGGKTP